jgi:hypothetical protein
MGAATDSFRLLAAAAWPESENADPTLAQRFVKEKKSEKGRGRALFRYFFVLQ